MDRMTTAAVPANDTVEALDLDTFTDALADRLAWLLPGAVQVDLAPLRRPLAAAVPADPLEEPAAALLMEASPAARWRYTVQVAAGVDDAGRPVLRLAVPGGSLGRCRPPAELQARMASLEVTWRRLDDDTVELTLPPLAHPDRNDARHVTPPTANAA